MAFSSHKLCGKSCERDNVALSFCIINTGLRCLGLLRA